MARQWVSKVLVACLAVLPALTLSALLQAAFGVANACADPPSPLPRMPICGDQDGSETPVVLRCSDLLPTTDVQVYRVPGAGSFDLTFDFVFREALYGNELGFYRVDSEDGAIGGLRAGDAGYLDAALDRATVIFPSGSTAFTPDVEMTLSSGELLVFYLVQNSTLANLRAKNPSNSLSLSPIAFFSLDALNPDGIDHFVGYRSTKEDMVQFGFEDQTNGGDRDYDDVVYDIRPPLQAVRPPLPIIFVHGWCAVWSEWNGLVDALQDKDSERYGAKGDRATLSYDYSQATVQQDPDDGPHPIYLLSLTPSCQDESCGSSIDGVDLANTSIREKAFQLKKAIEHVKKTSPWNQVIVVGKSQGGLVGRTYVQDLACSRRGHIGDECSQDAAYGKDVAEVITVDSPNFPVSGEWLADFAWLLECQKEATFSRDEMGSPSTSLDRLNGTEIAQEVRVTSMTSYPSGRPDAGDGVVTYNRQSLKSPLFERYRDARNVANIDNPVSAGYSWFNPAECVHSSVLDQPETVSLIDAIIQERLPRLAITDFVATPVPPPSWGPVRGVDAGFITADFKVNLLGTASERVEFRYWPPGKVVWTTNRNCPGCDHFDAGGSTSRPYSVPVPAGRAVSSFSVLLTEPVGALLIDSRAHPVSTDSAFADLVRPRPARALPADPAPRTWQRAREEPQ